MWAELAAGGASANRAEGFVAAIPRGAVKLIASLQNEAKPLKQVLREHLPGLKPGTPIVVMIGPEGDFTPRKSGRRARPGSCRCRSGRLFYGGDGGVFALSAIAYELME